MRSKERRKASRQLSIGIAAAAIFAASTLFAPSANGQKAVDVPELSVFRKDVGIVSQSGAKRPVHLFDGETVEAVAGDFDADGTMDTGTFDAAARMWTIRRSTDNSTLAVSVPALKSRSLGRPQAAPADLDGDGQTDLVVFCAGAWQVISPSKLGSVETMSFGTAGDVPVPADYDGDKRADLAVFRPSENRWYIRSSETGAVRIADLGVAGTDVLVPADYSGDGKADIAVYRSGVWHMIDSETGVLETFKFGFEDGKPAALDINRDGQLDFAVFRKGVWFVYDGSRLVSFKFGSEEDSPLSMTAARNSGPLL